MLTHYSTSTDTLTHSLPGGDASIFHATLAFVRPKSSSATKQNTCKLFKATCCMHDSPRTLTSLLVILSFSHTNASLERSVDYLERTLRSLSVLDAIPEARRRPKKRVRFCSPSRSSSSSTSSSPPSSVNSSPSAGLKPLPTILFERNGTSWRAVPAYSGRNSSRDVSPPLPYSTSYSVAGQNSNPIPPGCDHNTGGAFIQTLELHGDEWQVISARSVVDLL